MMAAGLIVLGHKSGGTKMDIITENQTGFLANDIDSYATMLEQIFSMTVDARHEIQQQSRDSIDRFNRLNFEQLFLKSFDQILFVK
jgi:alpha-1,2-mannosyltransferase